MQSVLIFYKNVKQKLFKLPYIQYVFARSQVVDSWYKSVDEESFTMSRMLIRDEGLLCGM